MPYTFEQQSLQGKSIIVTGGTTGIGRATAYRLVAAGANVLIFGRNEPELKEALEDIRGAGNGTVYGIIADTASQEEVKRVFAEADDKLGGVDILVNNAALAANSILDSEYAEWEYVLRTNLLGYLACCREAIDRMKTKGKGHIVNIGSMSAVVRETGSDVYVATKSGIEGFSQSLRNQIGEHNIKVTLIEPGLVGTEMTVDQVPKEEQPKSETEGTMLKAEEIAESVYYALIQPERCAVVMIQIRPTHQDI
jgi:NADP-dependent 3-hydroxy acid dehydrogenase YdfG